MGPATETLLATARVDAAEEDAHDRTRPLVLAALGVVLALGITALAVPFTGDQALFSVGARALGEGTLLYDGFWDLKQPGIFLFYRAAGSTFGFGEVGVHALQLCWDLALALLVVRVMRDRVANRWVVAVAPLLTVGAYYLIATAAELGMVESLVPLPILGSLWLAHTAMRDDGSTRLPARMFAAGLCVFAVASFKLMLVVVPAACFVAMFVGHRWAGGTTPLRFNQRVLAPLALGFALPAALFVAWAAAYGVLDEVWRTFFQVPLGVNERAGRPFSRLTGAVKEFVKLTAPLLLLAAVGARHALPKRRDPIAQAALAWLVVGFGLYLLQLWRIDLLMLLVVPIGLLATYGFDDLWSRRPRAATAVAVATVVVLVASSGFLVQRFGRRMKHLAENELAIGHENMRGFQADESPRYPFVEAEAAFLDQYPHDTPVALWADPLYLYLRGRQHALGVNGWAPEHLDQRMWRRVAAELDAVKPPVLFVDNVSAPHIETRGKDFAALMARDYHLVRITAEGRVYERNGTTDPASVTE